MNTLKRVVRRLNLCIEYFHRIALKLLRIAQSLWYSCLTVTVSTIVHGELSGLAVRKNFSQYMVAFVCLSRFKNNIDSNCERFLKSLISCGVGFNCCLVLRIDDDDLVPYYQRLAEKYRPNLDIYLLLGSPPINRNDFSRMWSETYSAMSCLEYKWFQVISDDATVNRDNFLWVYGTIMPKDDVFFISDIKLNGRTSAWYVSDSGQCEFVSQPMTVDYPCINKEFMVFLEENFSELPMFGPNMSIDTYWGMLFTETDFYKKVPRFIQREKQLVSFTQVAMANSLRKAALIENSSASYTLNREIIMRRFKEVQTKKELNC